LSPQEQGLEQASQANTTLTAYCFDPTLSFAEKSMWITLIELTGHKGSTELLSTAAEEKICREHAKF
jgi:hypothetical protein